MVGGYRLRAMAGGGHQGWRIAVAVLLGKQVVPPLFSFEGIVEGVSKTLLETIRQAAEGVLAT